MIKKADTSIFIDLREVYYLGKRYGIDEFEYKKE